MALIGELGMSLSPSIMSILYGACEIGFRRNTPVCRPLSILRICHVGAMFYCTDVTRKPMPVEVWDQPCQCIRRRRSATPRSSAPARLTLRRCYGFLCARNAPRTQRQCRTELDAAHTERKTGSGIELIGCNVHPHGAVRSYLNTRVLYQSKRRFPHHSTRLTGLPKARERERRRLSSHPERHHASLRPVKGNKTRVRTIIDVLVVHLFHTSTEEPGAPRIHQSACAKR